MSILTVIKAIIYLIRQLSYIFALLKYIETNKKKIKLFIFVFLVMCIYLFMYNVIRTCTNFLNTFGILPLTKICFYNIFSLLAF